MSDNTAHDALALAVPVDPWVLSDVAYGRHYNPHEVLGGHPGEHGVTIRTVRHLADAVEIVTETGTYPAVHEQNGIWLAVLPGNEVPDYRVKATYGDQVVESDDPYRFLPTLGDIDTYLIGEGRHEELWKVLGAHIKHFSGPMGEVSGVAFSVWAPNARAVRVVGDFNYWDGSATAMRSLGACGVWELFVPGVGVGARYKFEICHHDGSWKQKADPLARATEIPPGHRLGSYRRVPPVAGPGMDGAAPPARPAQLPHEHLRSSRRFLASGSGLPWPS